MESKKLNTIESVIYRSLNELKVSQDKTLDFLFHLKLSNTQNNIFVEPIQEIKLVNIPEKYNDFKVYFSNREIPVVHFELSLKHDSISFYKKLKYFFLISNSIYIYTDSIETEKKRSAEIDVLKFFFVLQLESFLNKNKMFSKIKLINNKIKEIDVDSLKDSIKEIWNESLVYIGINKIQEIPNIEDLCSIEINTLPGTSQISQFIFGEEINAEKKISCINPVSIESFSQFSSPLFILSNIISYLPDNILFDEDYQKIYNSFLIARIFNDLWLTSNSVINHWSSYVSKGKVIENFGGIVSAFLTGMREEFEKTLPSNLRKNENSLNKIRELSEMVQGRITALYTSQLLILQTQALDKFKDILIWQAKHSNKDFEFEKGVAILQVNDWFESKASRITITEMRLDFNGAKKELQQVLVEVAEKFKDSAVSRLISIQKTGKKTSKGKLKQSGVIAGFGITAAVRPRGFGNLQIITSYSHGPHVVNFSLVNDVDIAEQEGQTRIKSIRIQPSLNFDVDI